jgi:hypothetical protein
VARRHAPHYRASSGTLSGELPSLAPILRTGMESDAASRLFHSIELARKALADLTAEKESALVGPSLNLVLWQKGADGPLRQGTVLDRKAGGLEWRLEEDSQIVWSAVDIDFDALDKVYPRNSKVSSGFGCGVARRGKGKYYWTSPRLGIAVPEVGVLPVTKGWWGGSPVKEPAAIAHVLQTVEDALTEAEEAAGTLKRRRTDVCDFEEKVARKKSRLE